MKNVEPTVERFVYGLNRGQLIALALFMEKHSADLQEAVSNALTDLQGKLEKESKAQCNENEHRINLIESIIDGSVDINMNKIYHSDTLNLVEAITDTKPI